jgi:hypothetical protein
MTTIYVNAYTTGTGASGKDYVTWLAWCGESWEQAYVERDRLQAQSLAAGLTLTQQRFGIAIP